MIDLHKQRLLDAKLEIGTEVQMFELSFDKICAYNTILAAFSVFLWLLMPTLATSILSAYTGSFVTITLFYIKYGTN